jgi:hypothetical protein
MTSRKEDEQGLQIVFPTPRKREVQEISANGEYRYSFQYIYLDRVYDVVFERDYPLAPNLIDAVIDNFQIKTHGSILFPINEVPA